MVGRLESGDARLRPGFLLVNRWAGGGAEIQFTPPGDRLAGQLTRTANNRYEGFRESDGAALVMTR